MNNTDKRSSVENKKYDIDFITYWETKPNSDSVPLSIMKIDTVNFLGMNVRFDENGDTLEKIILLDNKTAYRFYYNKNRMYMSNLCFYQIRKNSPHLNDYSLVLKNYGIRKITNKPSKHDLTYINGDMLEGPNISFYENERVKCISYYVNGEIHGEKIFFDSLNGNITKKEYYDEGIKIK